MALWEDVKKNLVEWYTVTSDKTTEAARVGTRRWDKFGISRDIERQFSELGSLVYSAIKEEREGVLETPELLDLVRRIQDLETELDAKNQEIENIKAQYNRQAAAAAAAAAAGGSPGEEAEHGEGDPEAAAEGETPESVLTDPVLEMGAEESAILVEPMTADEVAEAIPVTEEVVVDDEEDEEVPKKES